jgi:GNAT superfamily N-acetyltransferase
MPYPNDPHLRSSTLELLGGIWTRLPSAVARAQAWGSDWCEFSTPFVHMIDDRIVAHVGVLEIPMVLAGEPRKVAGIHAVCTHASQRRHGHVTAMMERALAWVDARYDTAILWANDASLYRRFGFVAHEESIFVGPVRGGRESEVRPLSADRPDDVALIRDRLARRCPVSQKTGTTDPGWLALIDLALWSPGPSLAYIPALECVVVYGVRERFLDLYDVIAERIPSLAELAARMGERIDTAVVYFTPDSLDAPQLAAEPTVLIDTLMVRGRGLGLGNEPFACSPIARC